MPLIKSMTLVFGGARTIATSDRLLGGRFVSREFRAVRNVVDGWRIAAALYQRFNLGGKIAALSKKKAYNNGVARCKVD